MLLICHPYQNETSQKKKRHLYDQWILSFFLPIDEKIELASFGYDAASFAKDFAIKLQIWIDFKRYLRQI